MAVALEALGHRVSHTVVAELLHDLGDSLQGNVKTREGRQHPDRDAQFRHIARQVRTAHRRGQPAISVDTKKKELVGPFKNGGRAWRPAKTPHRVRVHDFLIPGAAGGKAIPYGVYDLHRDEGWASQRGHRSRHGHLRGPLLSTLVAADGAPGVSGRHQRAHHG